MPPADAPRQFPCKQCGARLDFDPSSQALQCPYCGFREAVAVTADKVEEVDYQEYFRHLGGKPTTIAGRSSQVRCTGCGALVLLEDKLATDRCPFCATHLENQPEAAAAMIVPQCLVPFAVAQRDAVRAFSRWIGGLWFAPTKLRFLAHLGQLSGVYLPFWTYDARTFTRYHGRRGDDYSETETYTERDAQGQTVTKTRQVKKTRWTSVSGQVEHFFDDVLICASTSLPEDLVGQLPPWDLKNLQDFRPDFLSGFKTERYAIGLGEGFAQARAVMDAHIRELCRRDIGGDHQEVSSVNTRHEDVRFKHLLLPVWVAVYRYQDRPYRVLVNGRTAKVVGVRPYSWVKITALVVAVLAVIAVVVWFFLTRGR